MHGHSSGSNSNRILDGPLIEDALDRNHTWSTCIWYACGLSLCITVDILQYSMPLAFLPSVLEDRGHSTMKIATAIGVYYWTGFAGGLVITSYQIYKVVYGAKDAGITTVSTVKRQIWYLIGGLLVGGVTLSIQALWPSFAVHAACRFIQGGAGAFIFFYTFLLSVQLFQGQQQVFAMTAASTALNVAEVLGSFLGAVLFDTWGQMVVFGFLAVVSVVNQVVLMFILYQIKASPQHSPRLDEYELAGQPRNNNGGWQRLKDLMKSRKLACAVLMIMMSAVVKGSVEEMLPFHADHEWGFAPLQIGQLFSIVAVGYIIASVMTGKLWQYLHQFRILFAAWWLAALGFVAYCVFAVASYNKSQPLLWCALAMYGACLGLTHTPAALLLADAIEHEEQESSKDAVNGIWNTMWEAGGSIGFLLGGLLAEEHAEQLELTLVYAFICVVAAGGLMAVAYWPEDKSARNHGSAAPTKASNPEMTPTISAEKLKEYGSMGY